MPSQDQVLEELDQLLITLRNGRSARPEVEHSAQWDESSLLSPENPPEAEPETRPEGPTGYFEEHLIAARLGIANMDEDVGRVETAASNLRRRLSEIETDLDHVTQEYLFLRERIGMDASAGRTEPSVLHWSRSRADYAPDVHDRSRTQGAPRHLAENRPAIEHPPSSVYRGFTVDRYNRTIDSLKARRAKLVILTLALSAAISAILVAVVLYSPPATPPLWIAALPLVWLVPIPFFVLSFRGTQRVLERNHLNLPETE